jgi:hypothetical protein
MLIVAVASAAFATAAARAQAQAPDSVANHLLRYHRQAAGISVIAVVVGALNADGSYTELYWKSSASIAPNLPRSGTYTYTKTATNTASLVITYAGEAPLAHTLTFTSPQEGQLDATGVGGGPFWLKSRAGASSLVNTSQRTWVGPAETAIIGFVVPAGQTTLCLIRAVGPGLAPFPGTTPALDPRVEIYRGATKLAENDDWHVDGWAPTATRVGEFTGAFPFADGSKDAATVMILSEGQYTVHVRVAPGELIAEVLGEIYTVN